MRSSYRERRSLLVRRVRARWRGWLFAALAFCALLALWEAAVRLMEIDPFLLPRPGAILATLSQPSYDWPGNTLCTATEIYAGFAIAVLLGVGCAVAFSLAPALAALLFPVLAGLNIVPKVALGPLVIMWFGYGTGPNILMAATLCLFPILLTTLRGLRAAEADMVDLVRSLHGSAWQCLRYVQFPSALPYLFSGMKLATAMAVAGAIVGEYIASVRGLGYLMIQVQASLDTPAVFMALFLLTFLGALLYLAVCVLELVLLPSEQRE
jgi:NitT/TauT family transport system permease protein